MTRHRFVIALAAIATALTLIAVDFADARVGRGSSMGSRGARTQMAPAPTQTAPTTAAPIQRSVTQPTAATAGAAAQGAARPGLFGGGMLGGLAAGFLGAGLFGLLFGNGLFGGMAGFASILGLILQVALIVIVARLAFAWWQRRNAPATAYAGATPNAGQAPNGNPNAHAFRGGVGTMFGANQAASAPLTIEPQDYDAFEKLLADVQAAYSAEDVAKLRQHATPEMVSYFTEDLSENAGRGEVNQVTDVKLLQGDLAEAWREGNAEYATVAMRFSLNDRTIERASGRVVETGPSEVTELWTFRRAPGGNWLLSAIQQG